MSQKKVTSDVKIAVAVFEIVDQRKSNFVMDGIGVDYDEVDKDLAITTASVRHIRRTSKVRHKLPDGSFGLKTIRYIHGCPSIDPEQQQKDGFTPNPLLDILEFKYGRMIVARDGADVGKYDYMMACSYNESAENRYEGETIIFKKLDDVMDAMSEEEMLDKQHSVQKFLNDLKVKASGKEVVYDTDKLNFLSSLFNLPAFESGYASEAWVALAKFAQANPDIFLRSISDVQTAYEADCARAVQAGVITMGDQAAYFTDGNKIIVSFVPSDSDEEKKVKLVKYMSNPKNLGAYESMRSMFLSASAKKSEVLK